MTGAANDLEHVVDRILHSETFRLAPSSKRLLKYLAGRCLAGESDAIKEYTIGVDAFNKPASYDPRSDSTVRIQIGRLRQKLAEYYNAEGATDDSILTIPKGRLTLVLEPRTQSAAAPPEPRIPWHYISLALLLALIATVSWALYQPKPAPIANCFCVSSCGCG